MRTIIDIAEPQLSGLDALAKRQGRSRAAVVREAVEAHLKRHEKKPRSAGFGLWRPHGDGEDGLAYQERMRREW